MPKRCVLMLLDGAGDRAQAALGGRTPLQAARMPNLDRLARAGASGLYHASMPGRPLASENAHFALFGYRLQEFPGRGALEALGAGIALGPRDVAVLAHLASLRNEGGVLFLDSDRPSVAEEETAALCAELSTYEGDGIGISFHPYAGLFGILRLRGDVSPHITDTNPMREGAALSEPAALWHHASDNSSLRTSRVLLEYLTWAHRRLDAHPVNAERRRRGLAPVNGMVTQRAGQRRLVERFPERFGLRGASVCAGVVYWGLCEYLGMDCLRMEDGADCGEDFARRLDAAMNALGTHDFVHVHSKAPDLASHAKNPEGKVAVLEALDAAIGRHLERMLGDPDLLVVVAADHSAPSSGPLVHSGECVPVAMAGAGVRVDDVAAFDEVHAARGALGTLRGPEIMYTVLDLLDRSKQSGIMDTPTDQPFWPGNYRPFRMEPEA
ncbi:2,3-bisphosphoglycerate-independent phosphoglycerate mutase [Desulfobaculum xiamenense]|uniref:2,3-bisphosphoglycerate-independent phosphoglycerate mutase n=1 Tax=Desulfobaculum xiamenense TaxID=995050 RepID=A0A846QKC8_9BACT|nr:alkaline phosphatase family protein [Desulfobaculum xiamenense]NJB68591.1 2,3-bisphosphoglycerate-independent phosphoglycerate mutase [Desulfobaculum xiamenense]